MDRPYCLPGCKRLDGHDGRDPGACMGDGGTVLTAGLPDGDFRVLAAYNSEVARGIVHTPEWAERMARLQAEYDDLTAVAATRAAGETVERLCREIGTEPKPDAFVVSRVRLDEVCGLSIREATLPATLDSVMLRAADGMTPNQIRDFQDALNAAAGKYGWKPKFVIVPAGARPWPPGAGN